MRKIFSIDVEEPSDDPNIVPFGRITITFNEPRIYFAYKFYDHYLASVDKEGHKKLEKIRALQSFIDLIQGELMEALKLK